MGGFLGIGGSSANTDRGNQLAATQGEWNIFNYGLPTGQAQQSTGTGVLNTATQSAGQAQDYYSKLLTAGRTDTATRSAPAINAQLAGADAQRTQNSQFGTGRSGGTASANANAGAATTAAVDNTINTNLVSGQQQGAQGLNAIANTQAGIGSDFLANAMQLLGLGSQADTSILNNATNSRQISSQLSPANQLGSALGGLLSLPTGTGSSVGGDIWGSIATALGI